MSFCPRTWLTNVSVNSVPVTIAQSGRYKNESLFSLPGGTPGPARDHRPSEQEGHHVLTIRLTTASSLRPARASRRMRVRAPWLRLLAFAVALIGISLALHFTLHTSLDLDTDGQSAPSHQCPADHINLVHSGLRDSQVIVERWHPTPTAQPLTHLYLPLHAMLTRRRRVSSFRLNMPRS